MAKKGKRSMIYIYGFKADPDNLPEAGLTASNGFIKGRQMRQIPNGICEAGLAF